MFARFEADYNGKAIMDTVNLTHNFLIAMPNMPVSAQRATSEKVMGSIRDDGGGVNLDQPAGAGQRHHGQAGHRNTHAFVALQPGGRTVGA